MKIAWICNTLIGEIAEKYNLFLDKPESWISGLRTLFLKLDDIEIDYYFPNKEKVTFDDFNFHFYSFPSDIKYKESKNTFIFFKEAFSHSTPDVIHIFGTEFPHSLSVLKACEANGILDRCVIHIQGLVSYCAQHNSLCLPSSVINGVSLRDFLRNDSLKKQNVRFRKRGVFEIEAIKKVRNVIGRTDWDRSVVRHLNPKCNYYYCSEVLRDSFYKNRWSLASFERHSIFISQSNYSLKGFHVALKGLSMLKSNYPDIKIYTTGKNLLDKNFISQIKLTCYQKYLVRLIRKYELEKNVVFLGYLNEERMCERMCKSHAFVLSSFLENSPNSLGESMIVGTPSIASYVGGISSIFKDKIDGYCYPFDEPELLAYYLTKIFESDDLAVSFSENARNHALDTHDKDKILSCLLSIYRDIASH